MRIWENYFAMVFLGLLLGVLLGGPPAYTREVSTIALILAMTFSLTEVRFRGISPRAESRPILRALALNYGLLSGLILVLSVLYADPSVRAGWVVMAAVPSAVAVIPLTSVFRGNVRRTLVSTAVLYLAALALFPILTLAFAGQAADPKELAVQIFLQIGIPLAASRVLAGRAFVTRHRPVLVNVTFAVLVFAIAGANRQAFLGEPGLVAAIAAGGLVRTFGIGFVVLAATHAFRSTRDERIADTLFATAKNLGLAALFGLALFGPAGALPSVVCLFLEIAWVLVLSRFLKP